MITADRTYRFRTATSEIVESAGGYRLVGRSEYDQDFAVNGVKGPIHKILVSAGESTDKGCDIILSDSLDDDCPGGYLFHRTSPIAIELRKFLKWALVHYRKSGTIPVYKENGVYNMYLQATGHVGASGDAEDLCGFGGGEMQGIAEPSSASGSAGGGLSGNPRLGHHP